MNRLKSLTITFSDIIITPLVIAKIFLGQKSSINAAVPLLHKIIFFLRGIKAIALINFGLVKKVDVLFVSSKHYEVEEEKVVYDKFISPFVSYLKQKCKTFRIARYSNTFSIPKNYFEKKSLLHLQEAGVIYSKFKKQKRNNSQIDGELNDFVNMLEGMSFSKNTEPFDHNYFQQFIALKNFYKMYLKASKTKNIVIVCYYDMKSFAIIRAANELVIPIIDLQHGVQGKGHFAYNYWPQDIVQSSKLFPTHFWCWDEWSANVIKTWFPEKNNVIIGYNSWMKERIKSENKTLIVFTSQPLEDAIPKIIVEAIKNYTGKLKWCIRLHPHQLNEFPKYKKFLSDHEILDLIEFESVTNAPLSELLNKTYIHITDYSSVVLEAMWYNIPSVVISKRGTEYYKEQVPENMLISAYSTTSLITEIAKLEKEWIFHRQNIAKEESFEELVNKFFKYNG